MNDRDLSFVQARYDMEGERLAVTRVEEEGLDNETIQIFQKKLIRLSGDLELPLESEMPGPFSHLDFRVGSDLNGAYVLYYFHDEVIYASLYLRGIDDENETELSQVFKYLLLDSDDIEEPTEEEIENVLMSEAFDFPAVTDRPAAFAVSFEEDSEHSPEHQHIEEMDRHLAAAFFRRTAV